MLMPFFSMNIAYADIDSDIQTFGNISIEGFNFSYKEDNSIQATADVYVENLRMTTMTIALKYHNYIVPSNMDTNVASTDIKDVFRVSPENLDIYNYFNIIEYPPFSNIDNTEKTIFVTLTLDQERMKEELKDREVSDTDVITKYLYSYPETIEDQWHINAYNSDQKKIKIGTISFNVTDSAELINVPPNKIESEVLESIQAVNNDELGTSARYSSPIRHYEEIVMNSTVKIDIDAQRTDAAATVPRSTVSAYSLYKNCSDPTVADTVDALFDYINRNMSRVRVTKASGMQSIGELIRWTHTDEPDYNAVIKYVPGIQPMTAETFVEAETLTDYSQYDPKGNVTYMIQQPYMKDLEQIITIFVTVTPSELVGFEYDRRVKVFSSDDQPNITWDGPDEPYLEMPDPITAIVTNVDDEYLPPEYNPVQDDWKYVYGGAQSDAGDGLNYLNDTTVGYPLTAQFTTEFPEYGPEGNAWLLEPWLTAPDRSTYPDFYMIDAYRHVIENIHVLPPKEDEEDKIDIEAEIIYDENDVSIDIPGTLEIRVNKLGDEPIPENTKFNIYLPNGWVLSTDESYIDVSYVDGRAIIHVNAMDNNIHADTDVYKTDEERRTIQSLINLGSDNEFKLSMVLSEEPVVESPLYKFSFDKRVNRYLDDDVYFEYYVKNGHSLIAPSAETITIVDNPGTVGYIEKSYSAGRAGLFRVYKGQPLNEISSYLEFPDDSTIPVMYHGKNGYQPAELNAAKVVKDEEGIAWRILDHEELDHIPADWTGSITLVGLLEKYSYTNFSNVTNPQEIELHLVLAPMDPPEPYETPDPNASPTPGPDSTPDPDATPTPDPDSTPDPDATPTPDPDVTPTPDPDASPTPVPGEAIEISTMVPPGDAAAYKVVMNDKTFQYDTKNVGYNPSQRQKFTIKNIGSVDIAGLTMRIADITPVDTSFTFDEGYGANFTDSIPLDITKLAPDKTLTKMYSEQYNEIDVEFRPLMSLPVGTYMARVIVGSRAHDDLAHVDLWFRVVDKDTKLFRVTVDNYKIANDPTSGLSSIGVGYLSDENGTVYSSTFAEGDNIPATAVVIDTVGYTFYHWWGWHTDDPSIDWDEGIPSDNPLTFQMPTPGYDITIKPEFAEETDLYLRLSDLKDFTILDMAHRENDRENDLRDTPSHVVEYDETLHTYYVIVDYPDEDNYVKFGLKKWDHYTDMDYTVTLRYSDDPTEHDIKLAPEDDLPEDDGNAWMHKSKDFKLQEGYNYVTITTTYTDEQGKTYTQTYKVIIHRRKAQVDVRWRPGNSPYGLIAAEYMDEKNSSDSEIANAARDKEYEAKQMFSENHSFIAYNDGDGSYTNKFTPLSAVNTYNTYYSIEAWRDYGDYSATNYDEVDEALFVYNKTVFVDPGFTAVYTDAGAPIDITTISRKISNLIVIKDGAEPLTVDDYISFGDLTSLGGKLEQKTISIPADRDIDDGSCEITELADLNVLPGVYYIEYQFIDETNTPATFKRPLIILPEKGDINVDGQINATDADILYQRLKDRAADGEEYKSFYTEIIEGKDAWKRLLSYRVGDTNEDRNVNSIDANSAKFDVKVTRYYEALPTAKIESDGDAKTVWPGMVKEANRDKFTEPEGFDIPEDKPTLVLDYLGSGSIPEKKKAITSPTIREGQQTLVWFGVGIKEPEKLAYLVENGLYSFDIAIDYDSDIIVPCDARRRVYGEEGFDYPSVVRARNLTTTTATNPVGNKDQILWKNADLYEDSLQLDLDLDKEDYGGDVKVNRYQSVFVTILANDAESLRLKDLDRIETSDTGEAADTDTVYLLRVPFLIKQAPPEGYTGLPLTINAITEQTFVMGATETGAPKGISWEGAEDKTTYTMFDVRKIPNAYNHFKGIEVQDLFNTDSKFTLKGAVHGWNPIEPFIIRFFREGETSPYISFSSISESIYTNGKTYSKTADGEVTWEYELTDIPIGNYNVTIEKQSHMTYPYMTVTEEDVDPTTGILEKPEMINLLVGDINNDGYIKDVDRAYLIHMFNKSRPWTAELTDRFDKNDLNGDRMINLFDLNLLNRNMGKQYDKPETNEKDEEVEEEGGGDDENGD